VVSIRSSADASSVSDILPARQSGSAALEALAELQAAEAAKKKEQLLQQPHLQEETVSPFMSHALAPPLLPALPLLPTLLVPAAAGLPSLSGSFGAGGGPGFGGISIELGPAHLEVDEKGQVRGGAAAMLQVVGHERCCAVCVVPTVCKRWQPSGAHLPWHIVLHSSSSWPALLRAVLLSLRCMHHPSALLPLLPAGLPGSARASRPSLRLKWRLRRCCAGGVASAFWRQRGQRWTLAFLLWQPLGIG
jgi:hypothetical protein